MANMAMAVVDDSGSVVALPVTPALREALSGGEWVRAVVADDDGSDVLDVAPRSTPREDTLRVRVSVEQAAKADAKVFAEEFPGEQIGSSDWDSEAWASTRQSLGLTDAEGALWATYRDALHAEVARLAAGEPAKES